MKIAFTSTGKEMSSQVNPQFGRSAYFALYDSETKKFSFHDNKQNTEASQGAGIQSALKILSLGAEVLLTGNIGPKAMKIMKSSKIRVYMAEKCPLAEALNDFNENKLRELDDANVEGHWM